MLHGLGKKRVIAIPLSSVIERNQKQVSSFQLFEHALTIVPAGDRIAEGTRQAVEKGRLQQKLLQRFRLGREYIRNKILQDVPVAAAKGHEHALKLSRVFAPLQSEREQAQPGHPTLCACLKVCNRLSRERKWERLPEKGLGLSQRKAQVSSMQFV